MKTQPNTDKFATNLFCCSNPLFHDEIQNKKRYVLIDALNLFYKNVYVSKSVPISLRGGLSLNIFFHSLSFLEKKFNPTHFVVFLDSSSWRKKIYKNYKAARAEKMSLLSQKEKEEMKILKEYFDNLIEFLDKKTNVSVLKCEDLEADDLISFWIQKHQNHVNIVSSTDSDFVQLLKFKGVVLANTTKGMFLSKNGIFDEKLKKRRFQILSQGKLKIMEEDNLFQPQEDWYELCLFLKILKGDLSDGILSITPNIKQKFLIAAFNDRKNKGFDWKNLMYQEVLLPNQEKGKVVDFYLKNEMLVDLTKQPEEIIKKGFDYLEKIEPKNNNASLGFSFLKFCDKFDLERIERDQHQYLKILSKKYEKL